MHPFFSFLNEAADRAFTTYGEDQPANVTLSIMNEVALRLEKDRIAKASMEHLQGVLKWPEKIPTRSLACVFAEAKHTGREITAAERWIEQLVTHESMGPVKVSYEYRFMQRVLNDVLKRGNLVVAKALVHTIERKWLSYCEESYYLPHLFASALESGNIECLQWLYEKFRKCENTIELFKTAAKSSAPDMLQWFYDRFSPDLSAPEILGQAFSLASEAGRVPTMQWFKDTYGADLDIHFSNELPFRWAISHGRIEAAQWLCSNAGDSFRPHINDEEAFRWAAKYGQVDAMQWMKDTFPNTLNMRARWDEAFRVAVEHEHDAVVHWFRKQYPELAPPPPPPKRKERETKRASVKTKKVKRK